MKLGADDPKRLIVLGALVVIGGYLILSDKLSSSTPNTPARSTAAARISPAPVSAESPQPARNISRAGRSRVQGDEFHPVMHPKRPEDRIDTSKIDPTLRLDLLAKVQGAELPSAGRNVFQFGPAPPSPEPKVIPPPVQAVVTPPPGPVTPPPPPPPPPINLKYYGFSSIPGSSAKTAFFLDGDEILVAKEGQTVKRRYRVVRIGATSVVMEDTESKRQQTLALAEEAAG